MELGKPPEPVVKHYFGRDFNSLQDVIVARDGSLWFRDSPTGFEKELRARPQLPSHIYRFNPDTGDLRVVAESSGLLYGLALSPDERTLYVTDTDAVHADGSIDLTRSVISQSEAALRLRVLADRQQRCDNIRIRYHRPIRKPLCR